MFFNQDELAQLTQKNIARGAKTVKAAFKGAEQLVQLQLNYIRQNIDEQAKFAQQFDLSTAARDFYALQQSRAQRIAQTGKDAFNIVADCQADVRQIIDEQQKEVEKEVKAKVDAFSPAAYFDPAFFQKAYEQLWANTAAVFDSINRSVWTAAEDAKKSTSVAAKAKE